LPPPILDAREQRLGRRLVIRFEEAKEDQIVAVRPVVVVVVDGGDAPNDLAVALGQEEIDPGVLVEGVLLGIELLAL
jgi:hypothetical protein